MGKSYVNGCLVRNLQTKWSSLAGNPIDFFGPYTTIIYVPTNFNNGLDNLHAHKQLIEYHGVKDWCRKQRFALRCVVKSWYCAWSYWLAPEQVLDQKDSIDYVLYIYIHIYIYMYTNKYTHLYHIPII